MDEGGRTPSHIPLHLLGGQIVPSTPRTASDISNDVFRCAFNRHVVNNLDDFILELGPAVKEWGGNKFAAAAAGNAEFRAACAGEDSDLREDVKNWFNTISSSSAVFGGEESQPNKKPRVSRPSTEKPAVSGAILNEDTKEGQFKTVFTNYARRIKEANAYENAYALNDFPDDPRGSLVTERSTKNLAFYVPTSNILFEGDVKNNANYKKFDAIRQCAGYLYFQLWWFRTVQLRDVKAVYGFTVCGSKCKDQGEDTVTVSLLILKVPDQTKPSIGANYELYEFSQSYPENSTSAFDLLGSFLLTDFDNPFQKPDIPEQFSCPGCMLMPLSWLRDQNDERNKTDKTIIKTGTGSLVICCNSKDVVLRLLENHVTFLDKLQKDLLNRIPEDARDSKKWILKCKTPASGTNWESAGSAISNTRSELRDASLFYGGNNYWCTIAEKWLDMYPVLAVVDGHAGRSIVVMKYMGEPFSTSLSYANFISEFKMLTDRVLTIEKKTRLVHGDIHEDNIRLDKEGDDDWKLRLIDWDEASHYFPTERTAVTDEQKKRYPDCLRELENNLYTKNQLLLLFSSLNNKYENGNDIEQTQKKQWEEDQGMNWKQWDVELDYNSHSDELREAVSNKYDELYEALDGFENESQGQTTDCFTCGCIRRFTAARSF